MLGIESECSSGSITTVQVDEDFLEELHDHVGFKDKIHNLTTASDIRFRRPILAA